MTNIIIELFFVSIIFYIIYKDGTRQMKKMNPTKQNKTK